MYSAQKTILIFAGLWAMPGIAAPVTISMNGTWGALTGSDAYFVSGQPWSLSIQLANPPVPVLSDPTFFSANYSNAVYTLNGNPVAVSGNAYFYAVQSFSICLDPGCSFQLNTFIGSDVLFTGSTSSPTFVPPGTYHTDSNGFAANDHNTFFGKAAGVQTILISSTGGVAAPEPASIGLIGAGLGLVLASKKFRRRSLGPLPLVTVPVESSRPYEPGN